MKAVHRILAIASVTPLFVVPVAPAIADNGNSNDKQTICHATDSNTNPYVVITPDKNGDVDGHAGHTGPVWNPSLKADHIKWGDIIPPFDYNDHGSPAHFPGLNWDANGQAFFTNHCRVPITAAVDKTNDANGDGTFTDDETASTVGASVAFKVVITNTSIVPAVLGSLVDTVAGNPTSFTCADDVISSTLAAGASATCLFTLTGYSPADGTSLVNTVTATLHQVGNESNNGSASDTSTVRTFVPNPDVSIVKTGPATAAPGDNLTWTLTVHNDGNVALTDVAVTDSLPTGTTFVSAAGSGWTCTGTTDISCTLGSALALDGTSVVTIVATLDAAFTGTSISNTGVVTPNDSTPADNTSTVTTAVTQAPDVSIVKTGPATAAPGDNLTWTLTVHNDGNIAVSGIAVSDTLPAGTTFVSASGTGWTCTGTTAISCTLGSDLGVGDSSVVTIVATLSAGFTASSVSNTAVVTPNDVTPGDNTSTATTTVLTGGGGGVTTGGGGGGGLTKGGGGGGITGGGGGTLPFNGLPTVELLAMAGALLLLGCSLLLLTPRRQRI
jgi:uncharacterized repeat protein (TIGR01451 family)